jgi:hypothetical protein
MKLRPLFENPLFWLASSSFAALVAVACSTTATPAGSESSTCSTGDTVSCTCDDGTQSVGLCNDPASCKCGQSEDSGQPQGDDAGAGDSAPVSPYLACARPGSFGAPCTSPNSADPAECTDPNFSYCFNGGQGTFWCSAFCGTPDASVADAGEDASDDASEDASAVDAGGGFAACLVEVPDGAPNAGCTPTACNAKGYCK